MRVFLKQNIPKRAHSKKGTFQKGHIPKRAHSKKSTFQKEHIPKRARSKKGTFQKGHILKRAPSKKSTVQKGHSPKRAPPKRHILGSVCILCESTYQHANFLESIHLSIPCHLPLFSWTSSYYSAGVAWQTRRAINS